jgi:hypothetical protein
LQDLQTPLELHAGYYVVNVRFQDGPGVAARVSNPVSIHIKESRASGEFAPTNANGVTLVVNGTIKNFDELAAVVVPGTTYFQIVPIAENGSFQVSFDSMGRVAYSSDLPKLSVPRNGTFHFSVPHVPLGKYFVAAQKLNSGGLGGTHGFETNDGAMFIVNVTADTKSPYIINAGEIVVRTH